MPQHLPADNNPNPALRGAPLPQTQALRFPVLSSSTTTSIAPTQCAKTLPEPKLKLPKLSQLSIAGYAGFIALAALYVSHSSANTSTDTAILANRIAEAALTQAQVANRAQLMQVCLVNSVSLALGRFFRLPWIVPPHS